MGAVVEDIAGGGVDWDCAGVGGRVWVLPVGACQLGVLQCTIRRKAFYPACNCSVSNFCCRASEPISASRGSIYSGASNWWRELRD